MVKTIDLNFLGIPKVIASYLIETAEGPILIETGPHSTYPHLKRGIENAGYAVEDIQKVFLTHIHLDHAGAAWAFAEHGAKIYLHPFGKPHMADPSKLMNSAKRIYQDKMDLLWGQMHSIPEDQLISVEHEEEIDLGDKKLVAQHTPGHASHHIAWQLVDMLFTGDVGGVKIENGVVQAPCPPPDIDIEAWMNSLDIIRKISPTKLMLTHYGEIFEVEKHLGQLEKSLMEWANWMKPRFESGEDKEKVTEEFKDYVAEGLREFGLDEHAINQYEAANPAWMSVAGLMRYWKKKLS
ncbi:MBL fold metallo-hydrolase [Flammeovirgaceae bacterium SG7u.111]|nr:MBL fold metallo-hydrolase [Flammeovirgaceae bacterium SG7u.132]WPO35235.1 MBL fold metallo-hydrolase [Flammeovirgaceae bacterium SG7u.111]